MPVFAALFGIVVMSSIGLPALNGFVGEFLILLGVFDANRWVGVVATIGVVLAACVMLWMFRRVMFGPVENPENRGLIDLDWRERAVMAALIVPIVWIGLYPNPVLRRIEPAVLTTLELMDRRSGWTELGPDPGLEASEGERAERWTSDRLVASTQRRGASGGVPADPEGSRG